MGIAALILSIVSAAAASSAALFAWRADRSADRSATATERSAAAAQESVALEVRRRKDEITPRFWATLEQADSGRQRLRLRLFLYGPSALGWLDTLRVTIVDDRAWRGFGRSLSAHHDHPEEVDAQIWGPYRFADPNTPDGDRTRLAHKMTLGDQLTFPSNLPFRPLGCRRRRRTCGCARRG
jgi:hypothetical protein